MTPDGTRSLDGGDGRKPITAADVATATNGRLIGDPSARVAGIAPLDRADALDLSFLAHQRYAAWYAETRAGVVLIAPQFEGLRTTASTRIVVERPADAMVGLLSRFHRAERRVPGVHPAAVVSPSARIGADVTIEPHAVVGDDVVIGDRSWIGSGVRVGEGSRIGADVRVHANVVIYPFVELGDRVTLHAGASVGREGFGFVPRPEGILRIPHVGRCRLEHDVEIGANSCIDRGSVDDTVIGAGTKIDNLVHIAHNVRIGRMCFIAAQTGMAGSTRLEDGVQIGGQVGVKGHLTIGTRATIAGQAAVFGDVPAGETWSGYPARPHRDQLKAAAALNRLARVAKPLERMVEEEGEPGHGAAPEGGAS